MIYLGEENDENDPEGSGFQVREVYESEDWLSRLWSNITNWWFNLHLWTEQLWLVAFIPILEAVEVVKNTYFEAMNILTQWMSNIN